MRSALLGTPRDVEVTGGVIRTFERGDGPVLVFVHGVLANANLWRKVIDRLADRFRCVTIDLPLGAHELAMAANADLSPPALARLVIEVMEKLDLRDVTLVGNDSGGALSQMVVTTDPRRVARLVLTPCDAFDIWLPRMFRYLQWSAWLAPVLWLLAQSMRMRRLRALPIAYGWLAKHGLDRESSDGYATPMCSSRAIRRDAGKVLRGISPRYTLAAAETLGRFDRPALIAWAREDRFFPIAHAEQLARILPAAQLVWIEDSYTFIPEDQPARLADAIASFSC